MSVDHVFIYPLVVGKWSPLSVLHEKGKECAPDSRFQLKRLKIKPVTELAHQIFSAQVKIIFEITNHTKQSEVYPPKNLI